MTLIVATLPVQVSLRPLLDPPRRSPSIGAHFPGGAPARIILIRKKTASRPQRAETTARPMAIGRPEPL